MLDMKFLHSFFFSGNYFKRNSQIKISGNLIVQKSHYIMFMSGFCYYGTENEVIYSAGRFPVGR